VQKQPVRHSGMSSFRSGIVLPSDAYQRSLKTYLKQSRQDPISKWWLLTNLTQLIHGKYKSLHWSSFLRPSIEFVKFANIYFHLFPVLVGTFFHISLTRLIRFEMNTIKSLGHERSNTEALSVVPFFSPSAQTPAFSQPTFAWSVFFAPLSTDYKKTKGLLVVYLY